MSGPSFIPLSGAIPLRRSPPFQFDPCLETEVARMWDSRDARELTDEPVLCVSDIGDVIKTSPVPYRYVWAQRMKPSLFERPLKSLAVSGVTWCGDCLVLGRRADWVSQDANCLELVPSGSVNADVDELFEQLNREMAEETGIPAKAITGHRIIGLVDDNQNHVVDVVIETRLACAFEDVRSSHAQVKRPEYSELLALTVAALRETIDRGSDPISAVSRAIYAHAIEEA